MNNDVSLKQYFNGLKDYPQIDNEAINKLFLAYYDGDDKAKEQIITSNLGLVVYIAKRYVGQLISLDDLIQEGNIGLIKAVENYNLEISNNFSNYAIYWIEKYIIDYINKTNIIVLPYNIRSKLNKILSLIEQGKDKYQICQQLDINEKEYEDILSYQYCQQQLNDDILTQEIDADFVYEDMINDLLHILKDKKDKQIVKMYLGIDEQCLTFQQIADKFKCSKIAIYKRYQKAIKQIREYYDQQAH